MEMYNGNGTNNIIRVRMTKEEVLGFVIQKYKNPNVNITKTNRKLKCKKEMS